MKNNNKKQRSAKYFMVVSMKNVKTIKREDFLSSSVVCADDVAVQVMTKPEHELEREHRLCLVKILKLEWVYERPNSIMRQDELNIVKVQSVDYAWSKYSS